MAENAEYILEPLREEADFNLYRGRERGSEMPILAVAVAAEEPSPQALSRLEYEWSLATELDAEWAARPLKLTRHNGRTVLILKDPGGKPLDRFIEHHKEKPIDLTRFLRIAISLTSALGQAHCQGLIHKDVKPENVLVDDAGRAWLTGFGVASRLPRERQAPTSPEIIAGTLAYVSPEQTGRMNRSMDTRSDLYSLGVTLYQMLTGVLPFSATDPLEWVHCHIARQPLAPLDRGTVPEPLSAIVMKLLAKNAEERYQTAAGLEADLRQCLADWRSCGRIEPFPLGAGDASDRLLIPEKLYGREREVQTLLAAFDRVVAHGAAELVLISGYSGVGKSSVVNELHPMLVPPRGFFASGKFDQYKRDVPYATLAQAFQALARQILVKSDAELSRWRDALIDALGANGRLLTDLVPELKFIIGDQPPAPELPPRDAQRRFQLVIRRFLTVFARPEHPLALFLDDLQWLDAATLDLLEDLLTQPDVRHVLLIGAYRDNEVTPNHPLMRRLSRIRSAGVQVRDIVLASLARDDASELIADSLDSSREHAAELTDLVLEKTGGNPFFVIQFLTMLFEEGLLTFDRSAGRGLWDVSRIRAKSYSDNIVDLMAGKLSRLPPPTQQVLSQFACLGNSAQVSLLSIVQQTSEEEIHGSLLEALRAELVLRSEGSYRFVHDRIQEAAYTAIPPEQRAGTHLQIGRLLAAHIPPHQRDELIFDIVGQFDRCVELITAQEERDQIAELFLIAGKRAKASAAHASALMYLTTGMAMLAEDCWEGAATSLSHWL